MTHDFEALALAARTVTSRAGFLALWKAAFELSDWFFVASDGGEDAYPVVGLHDGRPYLLGFTDAERAEAFSAARAAKRGIEPTPVLSMAPSDAADYVADLREQIDGLLMNSGPHGFSIEPMALQDRRAAAE
jgi:hypothetical protein